MPHGALLAMTGGDKWLLAFILTVLVVVAGATRLRQSARAAGSSRSAGGERRRRGIRRRAGMIIVTGPVIGFLVAPSLHGTAWVAVVGALALAWAGTVAERRPDGDRVVILTILAGALAAAAAGARFGPTGVEVIDVIGAVVVIAVVTAAANGLGNVDGLSAGVGAAGALAVFGLAGFADQETLGAVVVGLGAACLAFLTHNLPPASLFVGAAGRLVIGYVLAVGALSVRLPLAPEGRLLVPLLLLGLLLLDGCIVVSSRLQWRRSLLERRRDHVVHRLLARGWQPREAALIMVVTQVCLTLLAVFTGRGVLALWVGVALGGLLIVILGAEANRATFERAQPPGLGHRARLVVGGVVVALGVSVVPTALAAADVRDLMDDGRRAATRALAAARDGDDEEAELGFRQAAGAFEQASDRLGGATLEPGLLVPGLAPNLRAARTLADIGRDLALAGTDVTSAVDQDRLEVIDGRLPLEEVSRLVPALESGARALDDALARLEDLDDPYLLSVVSGPLAEIGGQLRQAAGEARRAAVAARLAPGIFGGDEPRTYLLIVQHPGQLRATGGAIVKWALMTAADGDVDVGEMQDPTAWNNALRATTPNPTRDAPADYLRRFPLRVEVAMQDSNVSPQFPSVAQALASLSPQAGLPSIDGVMAVDPLALAALLELTGPVRVPDWPTDVTAANVVDVTMRDQYAAFEDETGRDDFLGDVAQVVVEQATEGSLGSPARIAQVLGASSHEGHLTLWFARAAEQRLAEQLDVSGRLPTVRSDALGVYTQNSVGTKIDYFLERRIEYSVELFPEAEGLGAWVRATVEVHLDNTAPASGLPFRLIGPFREYPAGLNRQLVDVVTPFDRVTRAEVDGAGLAPFHAREAGYHVYSLLVDLPSGTSHDALFTVEGRVRLLPGGWYEVELAHQPTREADRVHVAVEVPEGWEIVQAPGLALPHEGKATGVVVLDRNRPIRVRVAPKPAGFDLWAQLEQGV